MPTTRGTHQLCELGDRLGDEFARYREAVERAIEDRVISEDERAQIAAHDERVRQLLGPLQGSLADVDNALRVIGAAAGAGKVTPWVRRLTLEAAEDAYRGNVIAFPGQDEGDDAA